MVPRQRYTASATVIEYAPGVHSSAAGLATRFLGRWFPFAMLAILAAFAPARVEAAALLDASNVSQAAGMIYEQSKIVSIEMRDCGALHAEHAGVFRLADYLWHGDNFHVIQVAQANIEKQQQSSAQRESMHYLMQTAIELAELPIKLNPQICNSLVGRLFSGSQDVKTATPKANAYLLAADVANPEFAIKAQRNDVEVGCVKHYWNKGNRDFDKGRDFCRCTTDLIYSALTEADRKEMFAQAGAGVPNQNAPWAAKLREKGQRCRAILQSGTAASGSTRHN